MNERRIGAAWQRDAAASARNARPVVEPVAKQPLSPVDAPWQAIARQLFEEGHGERAVVAALRRQGCQTFAAADAVEATRHHFRNVHHRAHRKAGLRALATGAAMWLGVAAIVFFAASGGVVAVRLIELVWALAIGGLVPVVFGLYKVLTGSAVPLVLPEDQPR